MIEAKGKTGFGADGPLDAEARRDAAASPSIDLTEVARLCVDDLRAAPCAVVGAAARTSAAGDGAYRFGFGFAGRLTFAADALPVALDTPFDLASLTKPVTALAMARLEREGRIDRRMSLGEVLPELARTRSARVPLDLFAAHRAGLDAHRGLYAPLVSHHAADPRAMLLEAANARRQECEGDPPEEGFAPIYSDMGYLLLGAAIATAAGDELDGIALKQVSEPLGLAIRSARQWEAIEHERFARVAPTEDVAWRGGVLRGVVHDENAWAFARTASAGHAGLFGDAKSVALLGAAILDALRGRSEWLASTDLAPLVRPRPGSSHLAGFDSRSGAAPSSGSRFGPRTFGHLGFTGTSLWIDPDAELVGVLLTNRVHPTRASDAIRRARPLVYDAIFEAMCRTTSNPARIGA